MRPDRLNPLFVAADSLKGVGTGLARPLERLGLSRVAATVVISLLALVVIPELRISDKGLIDVRTFEKTELFV